MSKKEHKLVTVITVGFALFAMFFGAGNLILPPYIGLLSGSEWAMALVGFFVTAILAPFVGVLTVARVGTGFSDLMAKFPMWLTVAIHFLVILCIGPLVAIPRTGATTYEVGVRPLFPEISNVVFAVIFFAVVLVLSISKSRIVDVIGKYLTPVLLLFLVLLVCCGILFPIDEVEPTSFTGVDAFVFSFKEGYQTLDVLASVIFAGIIISAITNKGYTTHHERMRLAIWSGVVSTLCLLFIYGGLIYLGATTDYVAEGQVARTQLLLHISHTVLGRYGTIVIACAIAFACLTTAIALTSAMGSFAQQLTKGWISYKMGVVICTLISLVLSINEVDAIIKYAGNILLFIYPIVFTVILYVLFFNKYVNDRLPYLLSVITTALISSVAVLQNFGVCPEWLSQVKASIPLSSYSLEWLLPSFVMFVVSAFIVNSLRRR